MLVTWRWNFDVSPRYRSISSRPCFAFPLRLGVSAVKNVKLLPTNGVL